METANQIEQAKRSFDSDFEVDNPNVERSLTHTTTTTATTVTTTTTVAE